jgi:hypothetical protein
MGLALPATTIDPGDNSCENITTDFDGSTCRRFAVELSFRWKARRRVDAAFGRVAFPLCHVRLSKTKAPRVTVKPQDREQ